LLAVAVEEDDLIADNAHGIERDPRQVGDNKERRGGVS